MASRNWKDLEYFLSRDRPYVFDLSSFEEKEEFYWNNRDILENGENQDKIYFSWPFKDKLSESSNILTPEILSERQHRYYRDFSNDYGHVLPIREMSPDSSNLIFMAFALTFGSGENKASFVTRNEFVFRGIKKINGDDLCNPVEVFYKTNDDRFDLFK